MAESEEDDSDHDSAASALQMMLGGIAVGDLSSDAWDNESLSSNDDETQETAVKKSPSKVPNGKTTNIKTSQMQHSRFNGKPSMAHQEHVFQRAFSTVTSDTSNITSSSSTTTIQRPPVRIVNTQDPTRGNIAIATKHIAKGEVIFTERAAAAALLPIPTNDDAPQDQPNFRWIRSCQHCFKSLEPASSCTLLPSKTKDLSSSSSKIPRPDLWPIQESTDQSIETFTGRQQSHYMGIQKCQECQNVWFCSAYCMQQHEEQVGTPHCRLVKAQTLLYQMDPSFPAPLLLATRLFAMELERLRKNKNSQTLTYEEHGGVVEGLCGDPKDISALELGAPSRQTTTATTASRTVFEHQSYSLLPHYSCLVEALQMTHEEKEALPLRVFEKLAAQSARNSVGFRTQSPFKGYFSALRRAAGGWGTPQYKVYRQELAMALVGSPEWPDRGSPLDRELDDRLAPPLAALFSLTARLNHSCQPNAQLEAQAFVDCHVDVVALRDIVCGEELTISYLGPVRPSSTTHRRRRELRAKYLFECQCTLCLQG